jgi:hypothetical protein
LDVHGFWEAIRLRRFRPNCGLYGRLVAGEFKSNFAWAPLSADDAAKVIGIRIHMCAVEFEVFLDPANVKFDLVSNQAIFRPWNLVLSDGTRKHIVVLSWPDKPEGDKRRINYRIQPTLPERELENREGV